MFDLKYHEQLAEEYMPNVTLKVSLGGLSVEVTGPQKYAETKLEELVGRYFGSGRPVAVDSSPSVPLKPGGKKLSPAEFLAKVGHKNQRDRALALAYYLEKVESLASFTTSDLKGQEGKTKYPFYNTSDIVLKLVSRGMMMNAGEKDGQRAYALTASGEEYVESMMESKSSRTKS